MVRDPFSRRHGYSNKSGKLVFEDAPEQVRIGLREVLSELGFKGPSGQRSVICEALRRRPNPYNWSEYPNINTEVEDLLFNLEWFEFYDLCERLEEIIGPESTNEHSDKSVFSILLNILLKGEGIGYQLVDGKIEKVGSEEFNEAVSQATKELIDNRFEGAQSQLRKAMGFRSQMPPDYPNAIKEAVGAIEGVWQVITGKHGVALPQILSSLNPPLPSGIKKIYDGLYSYGSGSQGARHAGIGGPIAAAEEVEFIIHTAAAAITYAVSNYG